MPTLYVVQCEDEIRLVDATSQAQAIRHVAKRYRAHPATPHEIAELVGHGMKVEVANRDTDAAQAAIRG